MTMVDELTDALFAKGLKWKDGSLGFTAPASALTEAIWVPNSSVGEFLVPFRLALEVLGTLVDSVGKTSAASDKRLAAANRSFWADVACLRCRAIQRFWRLARLSKRVVLLRPLWLWVLGLEPRPRPTAQSL